MLINRDLNPQLIYRLNRILYDILENKKTDNLLILPGVFDRYSRKFNWVGVHKNRWDDFNKEELKKEIINYIENNPDDWKNFLKNLDKKFIEETSTSLDVLRNLEKEDFYFHFLNLYSSYPIDSDKFIDGIIYNQLNKQFKSATGTLQNIKSVGLPLINITLNDNGDEYKTINQWTLKKNEPGKNEEDIATNWTRNNRFYLGIFKVIFYCMNPDKLKEDEFPFIDFIVFPIYDFYDKGKYYGNYYGNLTIFYKKGDYGKKEDDKKQKDIETILSPYCYLLATELEKAAVHKILEQEIEKDTILEHFIEQLPILQDWECIMVQGIKNTEIEYCYKRDKDEWKQCKSNGKCKTCQPSLDNADVPKKLEILLKEIFNHDLIPELDESDIKHCKNLKLICEYPSYTRFPDDKEKKENLEYFYKRQQLDLLRQLVLQQKVIKETIKHGAKTARATIISGSVSHNIGSHVLSSINDEVIKDRCPDVERLICYVQQRMDYIAGVTSDYPLWSEPTFFFFDLLEGFFQQGLLLDYITKDDGVPGEKIEFHVNYKNTPYVYKRARIVQLKNSEEISFTRSKKEINNKITINQNGIENKEIEKYEFKKFNNSNVEDFLVSIPGGVIGRHAFYALLENFMRNGAKYGKNKSEKYEVHIEVEEKGKYFEVKIYDNWSGDDGLVNKMQDKIRTPIVQNDGSITPGDWGIQEMKISADYLASPHITERVEDGTVSEEFFVNEKKETKKYRIWAYETTENSNKLSYKFILQKSTLVAVADFNGELQQEGDLSEGVVIKYVRDENLSELVKEFSPQLLIIRPPKNKDKLSRLLKCLKENHVSFPSRVLLCVDNENKIDELNKEISDIQGIPPRRYLTGKWPKLDDSNWEIFIINVYKEWIIRLGNLEQEKTLNLVIYFAKVKNSQAEERWRKVVEYVNKCGLTEIVNIILLNKDDDLNYEVTAKLNDKENILVFDNHLSLDRAISRSGTNIKSKVRHLHAIGTKELFKCKSIFDVIQNFPQGFTGMCSLLLLLESAIAKCLIIDERVIQTVVEGVEGKKIIRNDKCIYLEMAGCYIPIHMLTGNDKYLCLLKDEKFNNSIPQNSNCNTIEVKDSSLICVNDYNSKKQDIDYIVIHKSMLDTLKKDINLDIHKFIDSLYKLSPRVIVTSGKGKRQTSERSDEIDSNTSGFLEYSILKQFTITELSKYHLNRTIYSIKG